MIIPNKHLKLSNSLLGTGSILLKHLDEKQTVTSLWGRVRSLPEIRSFERFTLVLDFLFLVGIVRFENGLLKRAVK